MMPYIYIQIPAGIFPSLNALFIWLTCNAISANLLDFTPLPILGFLFDPVMALTIACRNLQINDFSVI